MDLRTELGRVRVDRGGPPSTSHPRGSAHFCGDAPPPILYPSTTIYFSYIVSVWCGGDGRGAGSMCYSTGTQNANWLIIY